MDIDHFDAMQEEILFPTVADYDDFWINANEANEYLDEIDLTDEDLEDIARADQDEYLGTPEADWLDDAPDRFLDAMYEERYELHDAYDGWD